jgi:hypothetical protein
MIAGTFIVTVTDSKGCSAIQTIEIEQPAALSAILTSKTNETCPANNDGTIVMSTSGGVAPYVFTATGLTFVGNTAGGVSAGDYLITATDVNLCSAVLSVTITQPVVLAANASKVTDVTCYGAANGSATVGVTGGTTPYTYLWSNGATDQTATGLSAGKYSVTVSDKNGCTVILTDAVTITQPAGAITVSAGSDAVVCSSAGYLLSGAATNQTSVLWTTSGTGTFTPPEANILNAVYTPSAADMADVHVQLMLTAKGNAVCDPISDYMVLTVWKAATADAGPATASIYMGNTYTLTGAVAANYASLVWTVSGGTVTGTFDNANALNPVFTPAAGQTGTANLTLKAIKLDGTCSDATDVIVLTITAPPTDITPSISAEPSIMHGITHFDIIVKVTELSNTPTAGQVTVLIPKDTRLVFDWSAVQTATLIGANPVSNAVWTYSAADPDYHIFTTTSVIPAGSISQFGFHAVWTAGLTTGAFTLTSQIISGSGGEVRNTNNVDAEILNYFIY